MMGNRLDYGDYVPDGCGGFIRLTGDEALLQEALFRLTCRRGSFPFLPELGSRLYSLHREKPAQMELLARQYAQQALAALPLTVESVTVRLLADGQVQLHFALRRNGQTDYLEVRV